jgi:hypothetical protein
MIRPSRLGFQPCERGKPYYAPCGGYIFYIAARVHFTEYPPEVHYEIVRYFENPVQIMMKL